MDPLGHIEVVCVAKSMYVRGKLVEHLPSLG